MMEYSKPELILTGQAEDLVLGGSPNPGDPANPGSNAHQASSILEFED